MGIRILGQDVNAAVSLTPLLEFWESCMVPHSPHLAAMYEQIAAQLGRIPALSGDIEDIGTINEHYDIVSPLMAAVFPTATFDQEILGALTPCSLEPFFVSPEFQRIFIDNSAFIESLLQELPEAEIRKKRLRVYHLILDRVYGLGCRRLEGLEIKQVPDQATGLFRYFGFAADFKFLKIEPQTPPPPLSKEDRTVIMDNLTDPDLLGKYIDLTAYKFSGFTLVRATDVTESQVISDLERDLIDQRSIFSQDGIRLLETRLQTLFQRPDISLGLAAVLNGRVLVVKNDCDAERNCLFTSATHLRMEELEGSVWLQAARDNRILRVPDLLERQPLQPSEANAAASGVRAMLLAPLRYQGEAIGLLEVFAPTPNSLGPMDALLMEQVVPIFSAALKRGLDEMDKQIQSVIKEKCTAVHPSVEWRFEQAAFSHMERLRHGDKASEMEPIVFKNVIPFYGQSDIRGSSVARNKAIQQDLTQQLTLALDIMEASQRQRPWPIIGEFKFRIQQQLERIAKEVSSGDEHEVLTLLNRDIAPAFHDLKQIGPETADRIKAYQAALDKASGLIYDRRRDYEESVFKLNQALCAHLEEEDAKVQAFFPHYFEKRQTDGVDYMMYIGADMTPGRHLAPFHIQDMTLWQLMLAWGLASQAEAVKPELRVPLDICHLILVNHSPLSIRFRFDEKRFDVDGAYDARHEIIKSRLDKAVVKGSGQRLTQPGTIAVVYATPDEGREIRQHIEFLTTFGWFHTGMDFLDLTDLPGVSGLKAIRVGIDTSVLAPEKIVEMKAG